MKTMMYAALVTIMSLFIACNRGSLDHMVQKPIYFRSTAAPEWARDASIYQVDIQRYTPEGTFNEFAKYLPHLREMGVEILWLMPVHVGTTFTSNNTNDANFITSDNNNIINPALGTLDDFKTLVQKIHDMDMKVIIDWAPDANAYTFLNKNANDNYTANVNKNVIKPINARFNEPADDINISKGYNNLNVRQAMMNDLLFWIRETGIDGYSCRKATEMPDEFWLEAMPMLRQANPAIFMMAESEHAPHRNLELFTTTYGESLHKILNEIAKGKKNALAIDKWYKEDRATYIAGYHMNYFSNQNNDNKISKQMNDAAEAMAVLLHTFEGIPLIYNDQESLLDQQMQPADKEAVNKDNYSQYEFYKKLIHLKRSNRALWNGIDGGNVQRIITDNTNVYAFLRERYRDKVMVVVNLSDQTQVTTLEHDNLVDTYKNIFDNSITSLPSRMVLELKPWGFMVLTNRTD